MGLLGDALDSALSGILGGGGSSSTSSSGGGYSSIIGGLIGGGETGYHKVDKSRDEGVSGYGSQDQYKPTNTTFMRYGKPHRDTQEYLNFLNSSTCYSGSLICPVCKKPKENPSELELCKAEHRRNGYNC